MGITQVTVTIRNPADLEKAWEELFLVDTRATDSLLPKPHLEAIGLKPKGQWVYELADGSELKMEITTADIEFMREIVGELSSLGNRMPNLSLALLL
jgi:clan AA aspartic protease